MINNSSEFQLINETKFTDGRNRKWVVFNDAGFFDYYCISCEDGTFFYMTNYENVRKLCELIKASY